MRGELSQNLDLIHAEALTFALAQSLTRTQAQDIVKALCKEATETGVPLSQLAQKHAAEADLTAVFKADAQMGQSRETANNFAQTVRALA